MKQLLFSSVSTGKISEGELAELLVSCRGNNAARGITGLLLHDGRRFVQLMEGEPASVDDLYRKICKDSRHHLVTVLFEREIDVRSFEQWGMGFRSIKAGTELTGIGLESIEAASSSEGANATVQLIKNLMGVDEPLDRFHQSRTNAPATILVVDDRPEDLKILATMLRRASFTVQMATSGKEALRACAASPASSPDLILLDVDMPEMNGLELCAMLKAVIETRDIPVIFISALEKSNLKVKAMELGAVDYITKPMRLKETLARIRSHLEVSQLRRHLHSSLVELEDKNQRLQMFSRAIAHDIRSPLSVVLGYSSMMLMEDKFDRTAVEAIHSSADLIEDILSSLLLMATASRENVITSPTALTPLAETCVNDLRLEIETAQAVVEIAPDMPACLAFEPWLRRALTNLITNALKYGGQPPHIRLSAEATEATEATESTESTPGRVRFCVSDNGHGLDSDQRGKLFKEFSRLSPDRAPGLGLGLVLVKLLVERMGGSVGVESEVGQGTTFYLELPIC